MDTFTSSQRAEIRAIVKAQLAELLRNNMPMQSKKETLCSAITNDLIKFGITPELKGFHYLRFAVEMLLSDNPPEGTTKQLYPQVAKQFSATSVSVERAMRHAIERSFNDNNAELMEFAATAMSAKTGKLNNSQFLALMTERYR